MFRRFLTVLLVLLAVPVHADERRSYRDNYYRERDCPDVAAPRSREVGVYVRERTYVEWEPIEPYRPRFKSNYRPRYTPRRRTSASGVRTVTRYVNQPQVVYQSTVSSARVAELQSTIAVLKKSLLDAKQQKQAAHDKAKKLKSELAQSHADALGWKARAETAEAQLGPPPGPDAPVDTNGDTVPDTVIKRPWWESWWLFGLLFFIGLLAGLSAGYYHVKADQTTDLMEKDNYFRLRKTSTGIAAGFLLLACIVLLTILF